VVNDLPERRCARAAWMVDRGRHGIRGWGAMSAPGGLGEFGRRLGGGCLDYAGPFDLGLLSWHERLGNQMPAGRDGSALQERHACFSGGTPALSDIFKFLHPCAPTVVPPPF
jgi:hypothetical protein